MPPEAPRFGSSAACFRRIAFCRYPFCVATRAGIWVLLPLRRIEERRELREDVRLETLRFAVVGDDLPETAHAITGSSLQRRASISPPRAGGTRPSLVTQFSCGRRPSAHFRGAPPSGLLPNCPSYDRNPKNRRSCAAVVVSSTDLCLQREALSPESHLSCCHREFDQSAKRRDRSRRWRASVPPQT